MFFCKFFPLKFSLTTLYTVVSDLIVTFAYRESVCLSERECTYVHACFLSERERASSIKISRIITNIL